ncbi:MAG: ExeM/NucH family extracellular endonuclease [Mycobacteriales bacterium]
MHRRPTPLTALVGLALTASVLPALTAPPANAVAPADSAVFVNEIHYDNTGTDAGEFVEVAGPAGTDLTGWTVVLYNGNGGAVYDTDPLPTTIPDSGVVVLDYPSNGIQNGSPDGVALVNAAGTVVQFLSYEGVLTAAGGPADGLTSTDIGVTEAGTEPVGQSLQLTGTGSVYGDFTWTGPAAATKGGVNTGQVFQAPGAPAAPVATCPSALTTSVGEATSAPVSAQDADSGIAAAAISSPATAGISLDGFTPSAAGQPATATLTVANSTAAGDYPVEITFSTDGAQTTTCTVDVTVQPPPPLALISAVQGSGATSPRVDERLSVEAVVTTLKTKNDAVVSYFLQEQDADADADPATSEGLLVLCGSQCPTGLAPGDLVRATGIVGEAFGMTRLDASDPTTGSSAVLGKAATPTAAVVNLPAATSVRDAATFENVEGMLVRIPDELTVSEYFNLARFGELLLTAGGRPAQFTEDNAPSEAGNAAYQAELDTRRIVLDDGSEDQNDAISGPMDNEPYPFPSGGLSLDNRFRGGDTITGLTGVLEYGFGTYRVQPVASFDYDFVSANPRTTAPDEVGGSLKVASFNVLNYFADIDTTSSRSEGSCGPSATLDCRGADSEAERARQLAKIVAALTAIDADIVGLIEIQNDTGAATAQIVDALNAATAPGTYDYIRTGTIGTDAIKQAFLYQPKSVRPIGDFATLTSAQDPRFVDTKNRPALIQTFAERRGANRVTVAVNHFKSKGSGCGAGDDATDGSGNCDGTRTLAAQALADYLATDPTGSGDPDVLVIGDLNSYRMERPITTLERAGYTDLVKRFVGDDAYSFVFNGQLGALDYALANPSLSSQVTGATEWHINADEPPLLDYNDTVQDPGEASFERKSTALPLYAPTPTAPATTTRSSSGSTSPPPRDEPDRSA